ncbi:MAG TPA: hypothetical protein VN927_04475 [Gemmatimonadaceae bacterium]|nr:hypothetical protein [Gemmatimonadaceae bacterium]
MAGAAGAAGAEIDQERYQSRDEKCPDEAQAVEKAMGRDGIPAAKGWRRV